MLPFESWPLTDVVFKEWCDILGRYLKLNHPSSPPPIKELDAFLGAQERAIKEHGTKIKGTSSPIGITQDNGQRGLVRGILHKAYRGYWVYETGSPANALTGARKQLPRFVRRKLCLPSYPAPGTSNPGPP